MNDLERYDLKMPAFEFPASLVREPLPATDLVAKAKAQANDPASIKAEDLFFWRAVISNRRIDSYFTSMAEDSLQNYAQDATEGVAFQNSHNSRELSIGRSINGIYDAVDPLGTPFDVETSEYPRVLADFYTVRNVQLGQVGTNDFIKGVDSGLIRDVSIGFKPGVNFQYACSVCGEDIWSWDCSHIPGEVEKILDSQGNVIEERLVYAHIHGARLSEVSAVYDGACPGAMITKLQREQRAGRLSSDTLRFMQQAYRINLPMPPKAFRGTNLDKDEKEMSTPNTNQNPDPANNQRAIDTAVTQSKAESASMFRTMLIGLGFKDVPATEQSEQLTARLETEVKRLQALEPLANDGKKLRANLITATIAECKRALGKAFDEDAETKRRSMLERLDIEDIEEFQSAMKERADNAFSGGRRSREIIEPKGDEDGGDDDEGETVYQKDEYVPASSFGGI